MFLIKKYRPSIAVDKNESSDETKPELLSKKVKYSLIALIGINLSTYAGMEMCHFSYLSAYYQDLPIHLSAAKAAEILSVLSATLTLGKLVSAFISIKVKPEIMISYHYVILAISMALLYFGSNNELIIWIGNAVAGKCSIGECQGGAHFSIKSN